jgi:two-component system, LytTR family, response regulator
VHALDYLLKPFDSGRFLNTLDRARERIERQRAGEIGKRLLAMVQDLKPDGPQASDRLVVKSSGRIFFVRLDEIDWIDAAGNYVRLHVNGESHLFRETMNAIEKRLDSRFVRIHRSHIVNADRIKELLPNDGEHLVVLQNGTRLTLSRGYRGRLQERLGAERVI